jgi:CO/xanthine dehydrogenase FAD-binding subunit
MNGKIRLAVSGLYDYPFRNAECEEIINNHALNFKERAEKTANILKPGILNNLDGSSPFRKYVLQNTLFNTLETLEDA